VGVSTALDDFGTGYSWLAYLSRLPIDELEINQSIVQGASRSERDLAILRSVIALAVELGMQPMAEGIEGGEAFELLLAAGCAQRQGYYFSPRCVRRPSASGFPRTHEAPPRNSGP